MDLSQPTLRPFDEPRPGHRPPHGQPLSLESDTAHAVLDGIRRFRSPEHNTLAERYDLLAAPGSLLDQLRELRGQIVALDDDTAGAVIGLATSVGIALGMRGFVDVVPEVVLTALHHVTCPREPELRGAADDVWFVAYSHMWAAAHVTVPSFLDGTGTSTHASA